MALEMKQSQQLRQELRMTPQLQQAIKLLQLSRLELMNLVQNEMVENPLLEDDGDRLDGDDGPGPDVESTAAPAPEPTTVPERALDPAPNDSDADGKKAVDEIDWEAYIENYSSPLPGSAGGGLGDELPGPEQTLSKAEDLVAHLLEQLGTAVCTDDERVAAEVIIGNLDENGYLRDVTIEELATELNLAVETVEEALLLVQDFDPAGVAARELGECLAIQAAQEFPGDTLLRKVCSHHISDLERKDYPAIARALGATKAEVLEAHRKILTLDPRPGRRFSAGDPEYITPDIYVVQQGDDWVATLNDDGLPKLRISEYYRSALRSTDESGAKNYVQERLRSAWWLIKSIEQRQRTILKVTESIIRFQRDFFDKGIDHLRPLVLREVADDIQMHESTISRVTTNKFVHTPRGIYELKFFFNSSIRKEDGDDIAAEAVKQRIQKLIDGEDRRHPYSDQQLVELLLDQHGIDIARRTVAKYREMLGILSSSKRRQHF
ncbi:MAG: RNA polymerase factor sigma-54 [Myxococcales bacterium]|nr:RNA polymerase factor sigma-54 [Myxococcales bacterium]MCB9530967.1 RNA polymerase factor sigma-54 [Myxococcales bacterium]MCB9532887.1 RNA polymerase factor sigma-54 [Myxococcales bacterium]